jgi:hypothetical protein
MENNNKFNYKFMQMANLNMKVLGCNSFIRWHRRINVGLALLIGCSGEVSAYKKIKSFFNFKLITLSNRLAREYCCK